MQVRTREGEGEEGEGMVNMIRTNEVWNFDSKILTQF